MRCAGFRLLVVAMIGSGLAGEVSNDGSVIRGRTFRLAPLAKRSARGGGLGCLRRCEHKVEPVPAIGCELSGRECKPAKPRLFGMELAGEVDEPEVDDAGHRCSFRLAHEVSVALLDRVVDIGGGGAHVEVAGDDKAGRLREFEFQFGTQQLEPREFCVPMRRPHRATVRRVQRHQAGVANRCGEQPGLVERRAMLATKPSRHVVQANPTRDRHAAVSAGAMDCHVVAEIGKSLARKLSVATLGFLQAKRVWLLEAQELRDEVDPSADRVHIPRCDAHGSTINAMELGEKIEGSAVAEVLQVISDLAEPLERSAVLERVGRAAAQSIESDVGFVGLLDGPDHLRLTAVHGANTGALETIRVERGRGLGGKVLANGGPASVREYVSAESITHEYDTQISEEGLRGVLCLPLTVGTELAGVAYVSDRTPKIYTDVMVERVLTAVESAKLALSLADRSRALTEAAVEAERQRTAQVLDASVGENLGHIATIAKTIAEDPTSSPALIAQAISLLENAGQATSALSGVLSGPSPNSARDIAVPGRRPAATESPLSSRELEVVQLAAQGMSNPEIAEQLFLARGTVKAYMESVLRKLDARNRVEAVMVAARSGWLDDI